MYTPVPTKLVPMDIDSYRRIGICFIGPGSIDVVPTDMQVNTVSAYYPYKVDTDMAGKGWT